MRKAFIFLFVMLLSWSSIAAVVHWNGGTGDWDVPANWDTGALPNVTDSVVIANGGKVYIPAWENVTIKHLLVEDTLILRRNAALNLSNSVAEGIYNIGQISNKGTILITGAGGDGILCEGVLNNRAEGRINILSCYSGLETGSNSTFENSGTLFVDNISVGRGLESNGRLINRASGQINIYNSFGALHRDGLAYNYGHIGVYHSDNSGLNIISDFYNQAGGSITVDDCQGASGLYCVRTFTNNGTITISNTAQKGLYTYLNTFNNQRRGVINVSNTGEEGIKFSIGSYMTNRGSIQIDGSIVGDAVYATNATINNFGLMTLNTTQDVNIDSASFFYNNACATFELDGPIINDNYFENSGWLRSALAGTHTNNDLFFNWGAIEDLNGAFDGVSITNYETRVAPLNTTGEEGIPIPNALDLGSLSDFEIHTNKWYTDIALTVDAGDYDPVLNEFTPNNNAVGSTTFYMGIIDGASNCHTIFQLTITGGVNPPGPIAPPGHPNSNGQLGAIDFQQLHTLQLFPNPVDQQFTVKTNIAFKGKVSISICDVSGRCLLGKELQLVDQTSFQIDLQRQLLPGVYLLNVWEEGGTRSSQRFLVSPEVR